MIQNRKILYKIKDSKRTMKNSKKKDSKPIKKLDLCTKKPPPLQLTQPINTHQFKEGALLKTLLTSPNSKLLQGFSTNQKKIISEEFGKMIKTLKVKLTSPQKIQNSNRSKFETKTQRFEYPEANNTKQTLKKTISTERKCPNTKSKIQNKTTAQDPFLTSPKKSARNHSIQIEFQQCRSSEIGSPVKNKKQSQVKKNGKLQKLKRKKTSSQNEQVFRNETYMLMGDTFVAIDDREVKDMQQSILEQNSNNQPDHEIGEIWKQFLNEKKKLDGISKTEKYQGIIAKPLKISRQRKTNNQLSSSINICDEPIKSANQSQCSQIIGKVLINPDQESRNRDNLHHHKLFYEEFYDDDGQQQQKQDEKQQNSNYVADSDENNSNFQPVTNLPQVESEYSCESSYLANSPLSKSPYEQSLKTRVNAISLQMKTNQEILNQLLSTQKIDKKQYQNYMDIVIENYDKEMTEADKLKEIIDNNQHKIDELIKNTNQCLRLSQKLEDVQVETLLGNVLSGYGKNKANNDHVSTNSVANEGKQGQNFLQFTKAHVYQTHLQKTETKIQTQPSKSMPHSIKHKIEQRLACQLSLTPSPTQQKQCINTSIVPVYQFIKNFYAFLTSYHLDEFLMYVNMPYGYSVEQRLRYMQGYDDEDDNQPARSQIVYGLEQVIRPALLEMYYRSSMFESEQKKKENPKLSQWDKLHNRVIFDAINQAINRFRPYYLINGCPYQWTTTEKALTYYFIREDCYEQLLQKVQIEVLKWSSSLCGLIIDYPAPSGASSVPRLSIQQIFERYTTETPNQLLQHRQQKVIKQQKIQCQQTNFQWAFHDQFKTALLYQISSCILEDLASQCSLMMSVGCELGMAQIFQLISECGLTSKNMV